ncbi:unnamed protein product [Trichobilharzia szidati]|nr:unnamed protein product [Trichobilharzia szidati]
MSKTDKQFCPVVQFRFFGGTNILCVTLVTLLNTEQSLQRIILPLNSFGGLFFSSFTNVLEYNNTCDDCPIKIRRYNNNNKEDGRIVLPCIFNAVSL